LLLLARIAYKGLNMCAANRLWSLVKRGVIGKFHSVSENYLPLYLNGSRFGTTSATIPTFLRN
jgi:hypothetical protein